MKRKKHSPFSKKNKKITKKHKVKFIINDSVNLALKTKADGCHLGQNDDSVTLAKKS